MDQQGQLISQITTQSKNWKVIITVLEDIPVMRCSTGAKLKRYVFTDIEGNEVIAAIYDPDVNLLSPMINLYGVYEIANAEVKLINKKYQITNNPFQWSIKRHTLIRPIPEAAPELKHFLDSIIPLGRLPNAIKDGIATADIMGVIIDVDEARRVSYGRSNVQHLTIIDTEMIPIRISIWDDFIQSQGPALIEAAKNNSIIVAKRLAIKIYDSISLSTKNSSSFAVDPPMEAVKNLKSWFEAIPKTDIEVLRTNKTSAYARELVAAGRMGTYKVVDLGGSIQAGEYWVKGHLRLLDQDQQLYYIGCSNCKSKIRADPGHRYTCFLCKFDVVARIRLLVIMTVIDETGAIEVSAMDKVAEKFLLTTTEDITRLHNLGHKLELESVKAELQGKTFMMMLTKTSGVNSENPRRFLLNSYALESAPAVGANPPSSIEGSSSSSKNTDLPLSPLKRQMTQ